MASARARPRAGRGREQPTSVPSRGAWPWALGAIFLLALTWRLAYDARLAASPLGGSRIADAKSYWDWASYLLAHGPVGRNPFFLAPLYPYTLAALRLVLGDDAQRVLDAQAVWGSAAAALLADAARRLTRPALGIAVGLMVACARMATFFDALVLAESLLFFIAALLVWRVASSAGRAVTWRDTAAWGALVGLLAQGRATAALLLLPALALAWQTGAPGRPAARRMGAAALAFTLVCTPGAIRNAVVSHEWIPFTYNAGYNLYVGNSPVAIGSFVSVTGTHDITDTRVAGGDGGIEGDGRRYIEETQGVRLGPVESSRWWSRRATDWMTAHPRRAAKLWLTKLALAWSRHESPQIENVDEFRLLAGPVGLPWLGSFAILATLAMAGLFAGWGRGPRARFLAGYAVLATLALVPFFVTDRYRHHLVPAQLLLAAIAVDALWRAKGLRALGRAPLAGAALGLAVTLAPVPHLSPTRYAAGLAGDIGERWLERGRADLAERELARAVDLDERGTVKWTATPDDSLNRAVAYYNHARALTALGREGDALRELLRAAQLAPGSRMIAGALAAAYAATGDTSRAAHLFARTGSGEAAIEAVLARGWALARAGDLAGADRVFSEVAREDRARFDAWGALVRLRAQAGRTADARAALEQGHAAGWSGPGYDVHAALVLAVEGRTPDARRLLARVPRPAIAADPVLADVVRALDEILAR